MTKIKYQTKAEREDDILNTLEVLVEKLEKKYHAVIMWNVDEITFNK